MLLKKNMYKNIIPGLFSIDTRLKKINGFYFFDDFTFYPRIETIERFHYQIFIDNNITIPKKYDFRSGYFLKFKNIWYYERKIGIFTLKFCFDIQNRIFSFNKLYSLIPLEIGHIFPIGRHIADVINLELFIKDFISIRGCAFSYKGNNICVIGPGMNGKTSLLSAILKNGGKYIAEDVLILNFKENKMYPTSNINNFNRLSNKTLKTLLTYKEIVSKPLDINKIFLIQNSTNQDDDVVNKKIFEYFNLNAFQFLTNHFIKAYMFEKKLTDKIFDKINMLRSSRITYQFKLVKNFNFNFLK